MTYTITHTGAWLSWNTLLSQNRWQRSKLLASWVPIYQKMFADAQVQPMTHYRLDIRYWSRADADNLVIKRLIDTLRSEKLVPNDDKRYFKGFSVTPDATLKHNTYVVTLTDLGTPAPLPPTT